MQQPGRIRSLFAGNMFPTETREIPAAFALLAEMREQHPVFRDTRLPLPIWQLFRYDDVAAALKDHSRFSSDVFMPGGTILADTLIAKDPPEHRKLRNLVNLAFTPRAVAHLSGRISTITQELLDKVRIKGEMDIVSDLAFPLPARVIAELLGVPDEDWDIFQRWVRTDSDNAPQSTNGMRNFREEMAAYFQNLLELRRREPREDLISSLSVAEIDGERLSEYELVTFCFLLLAAGQETTKNLLANAFLTLSDRPEVQEELRRDVELVPTALEEVLRYLPPVWFLLRKASVDMELEGQSIRAGDTVMVWMASANHDSAQFSNPDEFDPRRDPNRHLSFGQGIHFCIGAPLARLEARIALPMVLEQFKDIRVVPDVPIPIRGGLVFVVPSLPVTFKL